MKKIAAKLAVAGACVAVMILTAQAALVGAEPEREEFRFICENSYENSAVVLPATPLVPIYVAQSSGSGPAVSPQTVRPQSSSPVVRPSPDFTVTVSPDSQRVLNRIVVQEYKDGRLVSRDVESYTSGVGMLAATVSVQRSASFTITVRSVNGFSGSVGLSVSGSPGSVSCSFPSSIQVPANGQGITFLDITTTSSTPKGTYTLTVTVTYGGVSKSDSAELQVDEEIRLEGGSPSYVMVDDGMGLGSSRGAVADSYSVSSSKPFEIINGVNVPNYLSTTRKAEAVAAGAEKVVQVFSGGMAQMPNTITNTTSGGVNYTSKSGGQSSPATTSSKSQSTSATVSFVLAVLRSLGIFCQAR